MAKKMGIEKILIKVDEIEDSLNSKKQSASLSN